MLSTHITHESCCLPEYPNPRQGSYDHGPTEPTNTYASYIGRVTPHNIEDDDTIDLQPSRSRKSRAPSAKRTIIDVDTDKSDSDSDGEHVTKYQKEAGGSRRPKAGDYDEITQEVLAVANTVYRCLVVAENPFPDPASTIRMAQRAWKLAREKTGVNVALTQRLIKIVCHRIMSFRISND